MARPLAPPLITRSHWARTVPASPVSLGQEAPGPPEPSKGNEVLSRLHQRGCLRVLAQHVGFSGPAAHRGGSACRMGDTRRPEPPIF
jgi:hypothetical protein